MSFDEQPDGDLHGKCAAEIHALIEQLHTSNEALVAAEARLIELTEFVGMCAEEVSEFEVNREINGNWARRAAELMESSNLTALPAKLEQAEKDKAELLARIKDSMVCKCIECTNGIKAAIAEHEVKKS